MRPSGGAEPSLSDCLRLPGVVGPSLSESLRGVCSESLVSCVGVSCLGLESSVFESTDFSSFLFGSVTFGASLGESVDLGVSCGVCLGVSTGVLGFSSTMGVLGFSSTTGLGLSTTFLGSSGFLDTSSVFFVASP